MIISRTPFRLSLAGGGSDLRSYYQTGYGQVVSTAVNKYMYITVNKRFDKTLRVSYNKTEIVDHTEELRHPIVKSALKKLGIEHGVEIVSMADIPAGTGLGSSSSFTVGLLNALYAYKGVFVSAERLAREACEIEIEDLGEPIGKQDQYIAAYGGFQKIRFNADETVFVNPIICTNGVKRELDKYIMAFYTGQTRSASKILKQHHEPSQDREERMTKIRDFSDDVSRILTEGNNLNRVGQLLDEGWQLKRGVASGTTTGVIDELYGKAKDAGALGGKIAGAGGGGFMFMFVEPHNQDSVREALGLKEMKFQFEPQGSKIIYVGTDR